MCIVIGLQHKFLPEIDGLEELKNIICIGATNRLDIIDPAIMRPGRLYPIIKIDFPNEKEREEIFGIHLRNKPLEDDVNVHELAVLTQGMGGARHRRDQPSSRYFSDS